MSLIKESIASLQEVAISIGEFYPMISKWLVKPLRKGIEGFIIILLLVFIVNLIFNWSFQLDYIDLLLAGLGFTLKFLHRIINNFNK